MIAFGMPKKIILLTGEVEAPHLVEMLLQQRDTIAVEAVTDAAGLANASRGDLAGVRLISFLSDVIVPADVLARLDGPAYNFHPGPPEYPGSYVAGFAIYDGATTFGVTLHEMAARVDSGTIVAVRRFDVPDGAKFLDLEKLSYAAVLEMFVAFAPYFVSDDAPLAPSGDAWGARKCTNAEAERLKKVEADLSEEEIVRRYRAFG